MAFITGIKYTRDELIGIMQTIMEGAIPWAQIVGVDYTDDDRPKRLLLEPNSDDGLWGQFEEAHDRQQLALTINDVQAGVNRMLHPLTRVNGEVRARVTTDIADIDGEAADAIAQLGLFMEIVYG